MNVIFIDPKGVWDGLNNGLAYVAACIRGGCDVSVIDFVNRSGDAEKRMGDIKNAGIVGISVKSFTLTESVAMANIARALNPNARIIAGGPHVIVDGLNFMKENPAFDMAVAGEAEMTFKEIVAGRNVEQISGIIYRDGNELKQNPMRGWIEGLDALPFPVYDDFDSVNVNGKIRQIENWPLVTSRGCPYTCVYCNVPNVIGRKFRARSAKNIIAELRYAKEKYMSREFKVLDDNFTLQMDRSKEICRLIIEEKLGMKWACPNGIRADRLDEELCELMKEAGCYSISVGVESGDADVFAGLKKGEKLGDIERGIMLAQAAGVKVHGFFIIGLPGSTYEKDMASIEFAKKLGISASWGILVPYPGTDVWERIKSDKNARILRDWKEGFHIGARPKPVFETVGYTAEERVKAYYRANMSTIKKRDIPKAAKIIIKGIISGK